MDVRGAFIDGIEKDLLDETDNGRVVHLDRAGIGTCRLVGFVGQFEIQVVARQFIELGLRCLRESLNDRYQFAGFNHHRIDCQAGLETDLIQGAQVSWIGQGDGNAVAAFGQGNDLVGLHQLAVDGTRRKMAFFERIQVKQGIAERFCGKSGDVLGV